MGTLLKGGRYRLVQPYAMASGAPPSPTEPPLVIAHDTEVPNTRVLVQELPLGSLNPEDAEHARQVLTQRLIALSHVQGLAHLVDSFSERRRHFLVFEFPTGDLLSDRLRRGGGRIAEVAAAGIAVQVLDVLAELEREISPVTHGNICPAHIILRPGGRVALIGISPTLLLFPDGRVPGGHAAGMPGYAAPEQPRGHASPRVDLFSVCAVLYEAVTGVGPFARAGSLYQPVRQANPGVSLDLEQVLAKGLRPSPPQRYQTAAELRAELAPIAAGQHSLSELGELAVADQDARRLMPVRDAHGRFVMPHQRPLQNPILLVSCVIVLVLVVGIGALFEMQPRNTTSAAPDAAVKAEAAQLFMDKGIGLSGGDYVFDTSRPDADTKQAAERAAAAGSYQDAVRLYQAAHAQDLADAEAAIYAANMQVLASNQPYLTLIAGVAFGVDRDTLSSETARARTELQGISLAQQRINAESLLPQGTLLRVLILNSGADTVNVTDACKLLLDEMAVGNVEHVIGVIGWPESNRTRLAIAALGPSPTGLALVAPTASSDDLEAPPGSFFSMVPRDSSQAAMLADGAHQLGAHRLAIVSDPSDLVSADMAAAFADRISRQYADSMTIAVNETYTQGQPDGFASVARHVVNANVTLIYFAGNAADAINLNTAIQHRLGSGASQIHLLLGPQEDTPALVGYGNSPLAQMVRQSPSALASLYVAALADPQAWSAVGAGNPASAAHFTETYVSQFGSAAGPDQSRDPDPAVVLSYDAADLFGAAIRQEIAARHIVSVKAALAAITPTAMRARLGGFDVSLPFIGVGGAVSFAATGEVLIKAMPVLRFIPVPNPQSPQPAPVAQVVVAQVAGGKARFCGSSPCELTL